MKIALTIPKLSCSGCVKTITSAIQAIAVDAELQTDLPQKQIIVTTQADESAIRDVLTTIGYPALN
ncbi:heavy-metal-associated domain-containing protein [Pseudanabaena sp. FACHB-1998]|uniref:heavy-metal-associated domain-containing protein n=1 Tax=Pseudanabaena sp. FACHB-1998 TaxID=2692858 RepID=UPI001680C19F|nr:heavy-metal-associated domain-containing protein [Pseudanabaena sp. FACHB-1998]MBD2175303.1 heavy-metal-associated domain-containing protein [Pseudanabaena sp. FACHB-1998]